MHRQVVVKYLILTGLLVIIGLGLWLLYRLDGRLFPVTTTDTVMPGNSSPGEVTLTGYGGVIKVYAAGAVQVPGLYELPTGSRVGDLVKKSGGFSKDTSILYISKHINLAQKLTDGEKIYVPWSWEENQLAEVLFDYIEPAQKSIGGDKSNIISGGTSSSEGLPLIDINSASADALDGLPGIGSVYINKIIQFRPYNDIDDFINKSGLPNAVIEKIKYLIIF